MKLSKSGNLLQEAEAVSDLKDAVVSILPWVNFDALLPALKTQCAKQAIKAIKLLKIHQTDTNSKCFLPFVLHEVLLFSS